MDLSIEPLHKVQLELLAGSGEGNWDFTPAPVVFDFLYGIGSDGLDPFEVALSGKQRGHVLALRVNSSEARIFFGALYKQICFSLGWAFFPATVDLHITVVAVIKAEDREVVQALARSTGHGGCGGTCGCGCD